MEIRQCKKCGEKKPLTTEFFNLLSSGHWRGSCKSCMAANSRKHHAENPEMTRVRRDRYKNLIRAAEGVHQQGDLLILRNEQNDRCLYCGVNLDGGGELDHKLPISRGGTNWATNLAWACRECNRDKGQKTDREFLEWRVRLGRPVARRRVIVRKKSD